MSNHDEAFCAIIENKFSRIIAAISDLHGISLEDAMEIFYNSETSTLIEEGVADLHCRSDKYLAEEVWQEMMVEKRLK